MSASAVSRKKLRTHALIIMLSLTSISGISGPATAQETPSHADTSNVGRIIAAAREAAHQDRNAEAARLFERALDRAPARRRDLLREYADQLTYSGRPRRAISLYRDAFATAESPYEARRARLGLALALSWSDQLEESLEAYDAVLRIDPHNVEAMLGRARVLSWMDRLGTAKAVYESVLRQNPANAEARRNLARVQSWRKRYRDAEHRLVKYLRDYPEDPRARFLLAQTRYWMGRPEAAVHTLRHLLGHHPDYRDAVQLLHQIIVGSRPTARVKYQRSDQSNDLVIRRMQVEQRFPFRYGRSVLELRYEYYRYLPDRRPGKQIHVQRPGIYGRHRFNDWSQWTGHIHLDMINVAATETDHSFLTFDTYVTLWPSDLLRFDLGAKRKTFDNIPSLRRGITATYGSASMDIVPDEKTRFTTRFGVGSYTDGNGRNWAQAEVERRIHHHPTLLIGWRFTTFDFAKQLNHGYFNPESYRSNSATAHLYGQFGPGFWYDLRGSYGREHAEPGGTKPLWSVGARASYWITEGIELVGRYNYFSSLQASSGGFARGTASVFVRVRW